MPRTKGSKNKIKNTGGSTVLLQCEKQLEGAPITRNSNRGWVNWGIKNDYPQKLSELYYNSVIHKSCVDFAVNAIVGDGIDFDKMGDFDAESMPNYEYDWNEFIRRIALDYVIYGSYSFQIIKNKDNKSYSFYHQPVSSIRCGERNEEGNVDKYFISYDWSQLGKYPPIEIDRFGFTEDEKIKTGKSYLFVYETYTPDLDYYTAPKYVGGIKSILNEIELIRYDLRATMNNFSANGFLTLPRVETEEERDALLRSVKNSFVGADNANALVVTFSNGDELAQSVPVFTKIDKDVNNVNLFSESNERTIDRIVSAHRIPTKALIGMPTDGGQLGGDGNVLNVSYNLYLKTIANNNRRAIINTINQCLALNGVQTKLILKDLNFGLTNDNQTQIVEDNTNNVSENDVTNENLEEKITNIND